MCSMVVRYEKNCKSCGEIFYASFGDEDKELCDECEKVIEDKGESSLPRQEDIQ